MSNKLRAIQKASPAYQMLKARKRQASAQLKFQRIQERFKSPEDSIDVVVLKNGFCDNGATKPKCGMCPNCNPQWRRASRHQDHGAKINDFNTIKISFSDQ